MRAVDFFCGAGGMTRGLLDAGIDVIAGLDVHGPCEATYANPANNRRPGGGAPAFISKDITSSEAIEALHETGITRMDDGMVFAGCSPCQYWSKINTSRERSRQSRALLSRFGELVDLFRPGYVVVENVPGILKRDGESGLRDFLGFLRDEGYGNMAGGVVTGYQHGVPQKRRRYLLIATRVGPLEDLGITLPPKEVASGRYPISTHVRSWIGQGHGFAELAAGQRCDDPPAPSGRRPQLLEQTPDRDNPRRRRRPFGVELLARVAARRVRLGDEGL